MGLFDWLTGKKDEKVEIAEDRIWLTQQAKIAGIRKEVGQAVADPAGPQAVIVVAHFQDCLEQIRTAFVGFDGDRVLVTLAEALAGHTPANLPLDETRYMLIIVGERHPLLSHDEVVLDFARLLPCHCRIVYHGAFDDPLIKRFQGEWIKGVLQKVGMKEDEAVQSHMVSRRIQVLLKKIEQTTRGDSAANSAEEWLERNWL
jgi:hypothetical protein